MPSTPPLRALQRLTAVLVTLLVVLVTGLTAPAPSGAAALPPLPRTPSCVRVGPATPCAHSVQLPVGQVRGVMMIIAAGGWGSSPQLADGSDKSQVLLGKLWRDAGWKSVLVEHTSGSVGTRQHLGPRGFKDVVAWYDALRAQTTRAYGARVPVCAFGQSSAGNFALLLAVFRPSLSCVVTEGAVTDLNQLPEGTRVGAAADLAFPRDRALRARYSPSTYDTARQLRPPVLMGHLADDDVVSAAFQFASFGRGLRTVHKQLLVPGTGCHPPIVFALFTRYFAHLCADDPATPAVQQDVDPRDWEQWRARERAFAALVAPRA